MAQAHLIAPLGGVAAPDDIALALQQQRFLKLAEGLLATSVKHIQAQPIVTGVFHKEFNPAERVGPHQVNPHLAGKARQLRLIPIHSGLRGFKGDNRRCWVAVANYRHTPSAKGLVAFLPAHLQGEVLAFLPRSVT